MQMKRMNVIRRACEELDMEIYPINSYLTKGSKRPRFNGEFDCYQLESEDHLLFLHVKTTGNPLYRISINERYIAMEFSQRSLVNTLTTLLEKTQAELREW